MDIGIKRVPIRSVFNIKNKDNEALGDRDLPASERDRFGGTYERQKEATCYTRLQRNNESSKTDQRSFLI
jgi:hypothetical protein